MSQERNFLQKTAATVATQGICTQQEYNRVMRDAMGWQDRPYDYDYSRGLYFHEIIPGLIVGSQPRHARDVEELKSLGITSILSLQQDKDMHYWGVDPGEVHGTCVRLGMNLIRREVQDFDPHSLRRVLPSAVRSLHEELAKGGRVYVHCTAGLGRAPAVGIAYLYWFGGLELPDAYNLLTSIRPCGPKKHAVRAATFDLLHRHQGKHHHEFDHMPEEAFAFLNQQDRQCLHQSLFG